MKNLLVVSSSPHAHSPLTTQKIMVLVLLALLPTGLFGLCNFGARVLLVIATCVLSCMASEYLWCFFTKSSCTLSDLTACVTGLLLAYNLPPSIPLWMCVCGSFFAIIVVKEFFGGLGCNIVNPALAARAAMLTSWPVAMTTWTAPKIPQIISSASQHALGAVSSASQHALGAVNSASQHALGAVSSASQHALDAVSSASQHGLDAVSTATPLAIIKHSLDMELPSKLDMLLGRTAGCIGETCSLAILLGGLFLVYKDVIKIHIPLFYLLTVAIFTSVFATVSPIYHILNGGLLLGAFFMATDYVTSPATKKGQIIFAIGCGLLTSIIRLWGTYPEGVSYSILIMNLTVPLIDRVTKPRIFGEKRGAKNA